VDPSGNLPGDSKSVMDLAKQAEYFLALPGWNPYFLEGIKTVSYELVSQLESAPSIVYVGSEYPLVSKAINKGFKELETLGWLDKRPQIVRVSLKDNGNGIKGLRANRRENNKFLESPIGDTDFRSVEYDSVRECARDYGFDEIGDLSLSGTIGLTGLIEGDGKHHDESICLVDTGEYDLRGETVRLERNSIDETVTSS
jgi:hypothetical protein